MPKYDKKLKISYNQKLELKPKHERRKNHF